MNKHLPFSEKIMKIDPVDPEIIWLQEIFLIIIKKREIRK